MISCSKVDLELNSDVGMMKTANEKQELNGG
jgi:hypothetical protein